VSVAGFDRRLAADPEGLVGVGERSLGGVVIGVFLCHRLPEADVPRPDPLADGFVVSPDFYLNFIHECGQVS
jgi:hypothetical protein